MGSTRVSNGRWCLALAVLSTASGACSALYSLDGNVGPLPAVDAAADIDVTVVDAKGDGDAGAADARDGGADADALRDGAADAEAQQGDVSHPQDAATTWCTTRLATDSLTKLCRDFDQPMFAGPLVGMPKVDTSESYAGSPPASLLLAGTAGALQGVEGTMPLPSGGTAAAAFELHVEAMPSGPDPHILQMDFGTNDVVFLFLSGGNDPVMVEWNGAVVQQINLHSGVLFVPGDAWWDVTMTLTATTCTATIQGYGSNSLTLQGAPASPTQVHVFAGINYQSGNSERFHIDNVTLDVQP